MIETDFDIAICGAGPVGLALAALLIKRGLAPQRIFLFDAQLGQAPDPRSIALSYGSSQVLQQIGAWPLPAAAIEEIHVSRRGHFGRTMIKHTEHKLPALGYVTRYGQIVQRLLQEAASLGLQVHRPLHLSSAEEHAEHVSLSLLDGQQQTVPKTCRLLVQAEGGLFQQQQEKKIRRDYAQSAIVAEVQVAAPQMQRAFERFTDVGPLALLPLPAQAGSAGHYSLVWCVTPEEAQTLLEKDDGQFLHALGEAFGQRLGKFIASSPRQAFPLGLNAEPNASKRIVAIGNAAQTLHPVAGQGLNLGLRDAFVLASLLAREISPGQLQAFLRQRQTDRQTTVKLTDTMARIFTTEGSRLPQTWLALSLGIFDLLPLARNTLANVMMFGRR